jgi:hypothetical protein
MRQDKPPPDFITRQAAELLPAPPHPTPVPMKAFRLAAVAAP